MTNVAIVIPAYNRGKTLRRTLASLTPSTHRDLTVVVVDDGSEEDLEAVVADWNPPFEKLYLRQERDGFGVARARNLGASSVDADLLIFLDSDGIVTKRFVADHLRAHRRNENAVVVGRRSHLKAGHLRIDDLEAGRLKIRNHELNDRDDFREVLSRRTSRYTATDEGYRALVANNFSLPPDVFWAVGGFDERFKWWGGEDTELGWRLWQAGFTFIDAPKIRIFHQLDEDTADGEEGRQRERQMNAGLLNSLIPHRFYRSGVPRLTPAVPKVSVLVHDPVPHSLEKLWNAFSSQTHPDFELIFVGSPRDQDPYRGRAIAETRIRFAPTMDEAVEESRGELLLFLPGQAAAKNTLLQIIVRGLESKPTVEAFTYGVGTPEGAAGLAHDILHLEKEWKLDWPLSLAVRRRALVRRLLYGQALAGALRELRKGAMHHNQPLVSLPAVTRPKEPILTTFRVELTPSRQRSEPAETPADRTYKTRYIGWVGHDNLGDEVLFDAVARLMPWSELTTRPGPARLLLLGGGTLINRKGYLGIIRDSDSPRIERAAFGTGVANPSYWGVPEQADLWMRWLDTCCYVGVRGPHSLRTLESWGYHGDIEVCGDPALAIERPDVNVVEGSVLISPVWARGELWGQDDDAVYEALGRLGNDLVRAGHSITLLSAHLRDDRPNLLLREMIEGPTKYVAGYLDSESAIEAIASSEVVIGERLHACVLAAATGRPFVGIEYRPKVRDFAASVEMEHLVARTDELAVGRLLDLTRTALETDLDALNEAVAVYRARLRDAASRILGALQ